MPNKDAQVLVVGAGPAGATAAYFLAKAGVDVLLLDQAHFPRDKSCGDSIAPGAVEVLSRMGLRGWIEAQGYACQDGMFLSSPNLTSVRIPPTKTSAFPAYLIPRREFDHRLLRHALDAGAKLREGARIGQMERLSRDEVRVAGNSAGESVAFTASLVIAADGGQSSFTRSLGMVPGPADAVALRRYYEGVEGEAGVLELHWEKSVLPAYGFIFHMAGGRANVGTGMFEKDFRRIKPNLHELLDRFVANNPYAQKALKNARPLGRAAGMPFRDDAERVNPVADNLLVVGEAAGVGHPMTGEGIGPAMRSAEMAADVATHALARGDLSAAGLAAYARRFHKEFDRPHRAALLARAALTFPAGVDLAIRAASRRPEIAGLLHDILLGITSPEAMLKPGVALKVLFN
jgi:geranylgeranyl reductase family protein